MAENEGKDARGRFAKGNKCGHRFKKGDPETIAIAGKAGKLGGVAKRERKKWREELSKQLMAEVKSMSGETATKNEVAMIMLANLCAKGDLEAIKVAMRILGEDNINIGITPPTFNAPDDGLG